MFYLTSLVRLIYWIFLRVFVLSAIVMSYQYPISASMQHRSLPFKFQTSCHDSKVGQGVIGNPMFGSRLQPLFQINK